MAEPITITKGGKTYEREAFSVDGIVERQTLTATPDGEKKHKAFLTSVKPLGEVVLVAIPIAAYAPRPGEIVISRVNIPTPPKGKQVNCVLRAHINYATLPTGAAPIPAPLPEEESK